MEFDFNEIAWKYYNSSRSIFEKVRIANEVKSPKCKYKLNDLLLEKNNKRILHLEPASFLKTKFSLIEQLIQVQQRETAVKQYAYY